MIPADCQPADEAERVIEVTDHADGQGKHQWCLYWRRDGATRGQFFRADLQDFIARQRTLSAVRVVDRVGTGKTWAP